MRTQPCSWVDTDTLTEKFGIKVYHGGKWIHAGDEHGILLFDTEEERDAKRKELQKL